MAKEERPKAIFESYPCFKDPCEVVGEVRGSLTLPQESSESFMDKCVQKLKEKLDPLSYFGILKGALRPPKNVTHDGKIEHLMKGINAIFKTKKLSAKQVKADEVFHIIEGDEGPSEWQRKRLTYTHGLVVTDNGPTLLLGREIFILVKQDEVVKAVVTLLASFYLLDLDYF